MRRYGIKRFKYSLSKLSLLVAILGQVNTVAAQNLQIIDSAYNERVTPKARFDKNARVAESNMRPRATGATNDGCEIWVEQVREAQKLGSFLVIDTRHEQDFQRLHIPGALNIPTYAVKAKAFLKNQQFVLVNEGRTTNDLHDECMALQKQGFMGAHFLSHGLLAWQADKAPLEGDVGMLRKAAWILPQELQQEQRSVSWQVINLSNNTSPNERILLPNSQFVPMELGNSTAGIMQKIREVVTRADNRKQETRLLVVDENGTKSEKLEAVMAQEAVKMPGTNIYFLAGGISGYRSYADKQKAMMHYLEHPAKHAKVCNG